ncbi:MAG: hypothetical protein ACTSXQ_00945 [Alphaproteobacteria bacterium]
MEKTSLKERIFFWGIIFPFLLFVFSLVFSNGHRVAVFLRPVPYSLDLPLFIVAVVCFSIGLMLGSFYTWRRGRDDRKLSKLRGEQVALLEEEVAFLFKQLNTKKDT